MKKSPLLKRKPHEYTTAQLEREMKRIAVEREALVKQVRDRILEMTLCKDNHDYNLREARALAALRELERAL